MTKTILYAEDHAGFREATTWGLEKAFPNYVIETFVDGKNLSERLEGGIGGLEDVCAVVVDGRMPGKDGFKIISEYKSKCNGVPFILYSGDNKSIGEAAVEKGAYGFVVKPDTKALVELLKRAIGERTE